MSAAKVNGTWPTVRIGEVLRLRAPDVAVEPTQSYQFAGVYCFGRGVFRGQEKLGSEFAYRKLTRVRAGEFVYPKLMAWEGAFGVVPAECDGCHVSPEFPVFEVDSERVLPRFLGLHFQRPAVWATVSGGSTGTNMRRRRLNPADFLRREIPLPPLAEQRRIAEHLDAVAARVARVRAALTDSEADLERLLQQEFAALIATAPRRRMEEVAPLVRRAVEVEPDREYHGIAARSFGRGTFRKPPLATDDITWQKLFRVEAATYSSATSRHGKARSQSSRPRTRAPWAPTAILPASRSPAS
jgi:type I restriction enzyme S subunit